MNRVLFLLTIGFVLSVSLTAGDFGSVSVENRTSYELEEMLIYALEDEHLALAEYEALMEEFDLDRPYSNIIRSEKMHIDYLEGLYKNHNIDIPEIRAEEHLVLPDSVQEAAEIAVQAEINNIGMYEIFLKQELPEDVEEIFIQLKNASENHLQAFERQLTVSTGSERGRGRGRNRS